jgi:phosphate starvation-inducible membrane PsiE
MSEHTAESGVRSAGNIGGVGGIMHVVELLHHVENIVLTLIAAVLALLAVLLLGSSVITMVSALLAGQIRDSAIDILDGVLLVMMTMEIVYTVALSLRSHSLVAEPFLVVGAIAAIRRMLVITAESTKLELSNPDAFRNTLVELGLLAVIIIALAVSIYVIRRSKMLVVPGGMEGGEV